MSHISQRRHLTINAIQSVLLIGAMCLLLSACAYVLFGIDGALLALMVTLFICVSTPSVSSGLIMRMYRARELDRYSFPLGCAMVQVLSERAELEYLPRLYYIPSHTINAFTVGNRHNAAIAITDGLLRLLDRRELAGVLAHEISHIVHRDLWIMNMADVLSRMTAIISNIGLLLLLLYLPLMLFTGVTVSWVLIGILVLAPIAVSYLQLALSRAREFDADLAAAHLTGDPAGLASALQRLEYNQGRFWQELLLPGRRIPEPSALRTHPPTEQRIERLLALYDKEPQVFHFEHDGQSHVRPVKPKKPKWHWHGLWY